MSASRIQAQLATVLLAATALTGAACNKIDADVKVTAYYWPDGMSFFPAPCRRCTLEMVFIPWGTDGAKYGENPYRFTTDDSGQAMIRYSGAVPKPVARVEVALAYADPTCAFTKPGGGWKYPLARASQEGVKLAAYGRRPDYELTGELYFEVPLTEQCHPR